MGRPAFQPTTEQREQVAEWHRARVSGAEIGRRLGITKPTLWKHFRAELGALSAAVARDKPKKTSAAPVVSAECDLPLWSGLSNVERPSFPANAVREEAPESKGIVAPDLAPASPSEAESAFRSTAQQRKDVEALAAAQLPVDEIAAYLGLDEVVVLEHFATELANGPAKNRAELVLSIRRQAAGGNVSAQRLFLAIATPSPGAKVKAKEEDQKPLTTSQIGKKVAETLAAHRAVNAGGKYAPPPPPKLVVDNNK